MRNWKDLNVLTSYKAGNMFAMDVIENVYQDYKQMARNYGRLINKEDALENICSYIEEHILGCVDSFLDEKFDYE